MNIMTATLGCKVNQYETEMIKEKFYQRGYAYTSEVEKADIIVINSCSVTNLADRKARQMIRSMKKKSPESIMVVTGCYPQTSPEALKDMEEVDIITGTNHKSEIVDMVEELLESRKADNEGEDSGQLKQTVKIDSYDKLVEAKYEETGLIASLETRTRGNIKIQEGCNRFCAYCIIPYARGRVRSRKLQDILEEAKLLVDKGCKEIVLTGINTALYTYRDGGIEKILEKLDEMAGDFRVRLSSLEPTVINAEYVGNLLKYKRLCPHLHLSVQSGSDKIIKLMNRKYTVEEYLKIVEVLKKFDNNYGITTDIIVGFPQETEEDFRESLKLIEKVGFCKVHGFRYSKRKGTRAADMEGQVSPDVKNRRIRDLISFADSESKKFFERCAGEERSVLIEEYDEKNSEWTGYTENYIKVYLKSSDNAEDGGGFINKFVKVELLYPYRDGMKGEFLVNSQSEF